MGLFDDVSKFLEDRLDEFLQNNPHLELQALEEQLKEQERDTLKLILKLQQEEQKLQQEILTVAEEIQTWHQRVSKAKMAGRQDLATAAAEREASLLRQGNQLWGQMEGTKKHIVQSKELARQIQLKRTEIQAKYQEGAQSNTDRPTDRSTANNTSTTGWERGAQKTSYDRASDSLEAQFQSWEMEAELEQMKRDLGK
jgi:uncharacterized protein (TIGR04376 family)